MNDAAQSPNIYYGVHVPGWLQDLSPVTAFETSARKPVSIVMLYQGWGLTDGSQNFEPGWMDTIRNHGSIPLVTWEPWLYTQGVNQPAHSLQNTINGAHDNYITQWARDSQVWGYPYFLRFAHEMNGNWYPWSERVNNNKPGQYVLAWRHVHDLFSAQGVTNVTWVWSPNIAYSGGAPLKSLYPGDAYVDWVGMDGYNWGTVSQHQWQTFAQVFQQTYNEMLTISSKPFMIAETASTELGGNKAGWITDGFSNQLPHAFPKIKAVVWFNENKETDWRIESSPAAQMAFANAISSNIYASNQYATLNTSPIPPL
jgi:Glycosyl hydrolase family 26